MYDTIITHCPATGKDPICWKGVQCVYDGGQKQICVNICIDCQYVSKEERRKINDDLHKN